MKYASHKEFLLQFAGLSDWVLGLKLFKGLAQVLNRDLCISHFDHLKHRIMDEYVLPLQTDRQREREREGHVIWSWSCDNHVIPQSGPYSCAVFSSPK